MIEFFELPGGQMLRIEGSKVEVDAARDWMHERGVVKVWDLGGGTFRVAYSEHFGGHKNFSEVTIKVVGPLEALALEAE